MIDVPHYVAERVRRSVPEGCSVVAGSTPVVSFGNAATARVATLGLNPSRREFVSTAGAWLVGSERRLATHESIGLSDLTRATDQQVAEVVHDCYDYFARNPYAWFADLERLMAISCGLSYYDGSACHLDLVQWATDPVWQHLATPVQTELVVADSAFLIKQIRQEQIAVVLMNGRGVIDQVKKMGVDLSQCAPAQHQARSCEIVTGVGLGARFVGWSANLQSSHGMSHNFKRAIADRVRAEIETADMSVPPETSASTHDIERGMTVNSKIEFFHLLDRWASTSQADTVGHLGTYPGKPWVTLVAGDLRVVLNADTRRSAVTEFLEYSRSHGADTRWNVVANSRGVINRVVYRTDAPLAGWYCYTTRPLAVEGEL